MDERTKVICRCFRLALEGNGEKLGGSIERSIFRLFLKEYPEVSGSLLRVGQEWAGEDWAHWYYAEYECFESRPEHAKKKVDIVID